MTRKKANILITGTPGTGKTRLADEVYSKLDPTYTLIHVGDVVKEHDLAKEYDPKLDTYILDEDGLIERIECLMETSCSEGGCIIEYHGADLFPGDWIDGVFCLRTSTNILFDRLDERGYSDIKRQNNMEAEIFQTILDEAKDHFDHLNVIEMKSDSQEDMNHNVQSIVTFLQHFCDQNDK